MDPVACMNTVEDLLAGRSPEDFEDARLMLEDLNEWFRMGGFGDRLRAQALEAKLLLTLERI